MYCFDPQIKGKTGDLCNGSQGCNPHEIYANYLRLGALKSGRRIWEAARKDGDKIPGNYIEIRLR